MFKKAAVYIKEKINKNGFTFAEMLFAVLILGIATGLMAQTVGVAFNNFEKITKKSEAQMLCSVLVASVQDELLYAKNIKAGTVPEYFSSSRDMGESCKIVAATYSGSDSADAYSGASTNGELCVYSDYSASGESADTDSVKYYPLVAHASYAPQNRVGVNTHSDYLTSSIDYSWAGKKFHVSLKVLDGKDSTTVLS